MEQSAPDPMDVDSREEAPPPIPAPPENAVRTRCYKLNLDSEFVGLSSSQKQQLCLGPFSEPPPYLTYSSSTDSSDGINPTTVAIQTAQIFRGITISRDGTILSQNARATRSNRGNKTKRGEKSRQAAKIDKAKDLVEEALLSGTNTEDGPTNMVSLVIVGEYDDMKQLVRDGSRKLRDAEGLPDEALLNINRPRSSQTSKTPKSPRSRRAPSTNGQRTSTPSSGKRASAGSSAGADARNATSIYNNNVADKATTPSVPPKLKSHPRDTRSGRKDERAGMRTRLDACHGFMDTRRSGNTDDGDWSHAWNIWNCGGAGTVSPVQPSSPKDNAKVVFEDREANYGNARETGATGRMH
jgi:hypothetical protein